MSKGRLEAFSDGVIAILITIMVLELRAPEGTDLASLLPLGPDFLGYVLSFALLGIYWNNHHHLFQAAKVVDGRVLLANLVLLFCLSLFPFATAWMGRNDFAPIPTAGYGVVSLAAAFAYYLVVHTLIASPGQEPNLAKAIGNDFKGKISPLAYAAAVPIALVAPYVSLAIFGLIVLLWIVPDSRIERSLAARRGAGEKRDAGGDPAGPEQP